MIIQTRIFLCDICGKVISEIDNDGNYDEDTAYYPEGWIEVYDITGNNPKGHCPECAKEHVEEYALGRGSFPSYYYKKETV